MSGEPDASASTWPRVSLLPSLHLFSCHWVKGQGSREDLLTWAPSWEGRQLGWSHSRGALELLGSSWEFGKACPSASRPAACLVLAHIGRGFMREGAKVVPTFSLLSSSASLWTRGSLGPCVSLMHTEVALWG